MGTVNSSLQILGESRVERKRNAEELIGYNGNEKNIDVFVKINDIYIRDKFLDSIISMDILYCTSSFIKSRAIRLIGLMNKNQKKHRKRFKL